MDEIRYVFVPGWVRVGGVEVGLSERAFVWRAESADGTHILEVPRSGWQFGEFVNILRRIDRDGW